MKNYNRTKILLQILNKSDQVMDNIVQLTEQISAIKNGMYDYLDEAPLFNSRGSNTDTNGINDSRKTLIENFKESAAK